MLVHCLRRGVKASWGMLPCISTLFYRDRYGTVLGASGHSLSIDSTMPHIQHGLRTLLLQVLADLI